MATKYSRMTEEQKKRAHANNKKWKLKNREKWAEYKRKHYLKNRDKYLKIERERSWLKRYGVTPERYEQMLAAQNGKCAICAVEKAGNRIEFFAIDHDHKFGHVRGLLCQKCNSLLGWFEANQSGVLEYLARSARMVAA